MNISEKNQLAKRLPSPVPGVKITIPLNLWPAYMKLHQLDPKEYLEEEEILIVKKWTGNDYSGGELPQESVRR